MSKNDPRDPVKNYILQSFMFSYYFSIKIFLFFFNFYFIFKLYNIVLVLPNIEMNPPQVYISFLCIIFKKNLFKLCTETKYMKHEIRVGLIDLRCTYNWEEWFSALSLPLISVGPEHLCEIPRGKV